MSTNTILERVMMVIPLLLSLSVHEWAHAFSAHKLGDDTAARQGRLTLNPLAHIDLVGTLLLPLLGIPFGWAKPVPVNPMRFRRSITMRTGMMITASAGPLSNVAIALLSTVIFGLLVRFRPEWVMAHSAVPMLLRIAIQMNVALAIFNMLPIPPLDGSRVVDGLLPERLRRGWESWVRISQYVLIAVILAPSIFHVRVIGWPVEKAMTVLEWLLRIVAGVDA